MMLKLTDLPTTTDSKMLISLEIRNSNLISEKEKVVRIKFNSLMNLLSIIVKRETTHLTTKRCHWVCLWTIQKEYISVLLIIVEIKIMDYPLTNTSTPFKVKYKTDPVIIFLLKKIKSTGQSIKIRSTITDTKTLIFHSVDWWGNFSSIQLKKKTQKVSSFRQLPGQKSFLA